MIPKVKTGAGFSGVLNYALKEEKEAEILDKNMFGLTPEELNKEFRMVADTNTRAEKKMKHFILSFADADRPSLTPEKMVNISKDFIKEMGYTDNQYVTVRHTDSKHDHLHIIVNRIRLEDRKAVKDGREKYHGSRIAREIEKKYGLTVTPSRKEDEEIKYENKEETELKKRLSNQAVPTLTDKEAIQSQVRKAMKESRTMLDVIKKVKESGIIVHVTGNKKGDITGWKFGYKGREYKASTVDRQLSWGNAEKQMKEQNRQSKTKGMGL